MRSSVSRPPSPTCILLFHGNGEIAADYDALGALYGGCGASFWVVEYRGYGRSTGTLSFSTLLEDAECVAADVPRIVRTCRDDDATVNLIGRSLGSAPDLVRRPGGPRISDQARASLRDNVDLVPDCTIPTLIIHGTHDRIIPVEEAEALNTACGSHVKRLVKINDAGHNTLLQVGLARYRAEIKDHIARATTAGPSGYGRRSFGSASSGL